MKKRFMKILSCILAIVILLPTIVLIPQTNTLLTIYAATEDEAIEDAYYELQKASLSKAGDWWTAINVDGCRPNFFHNEVQNHIVKLNEGMEKELPINFKELTLNPVTGKYSMTGKADLYMRYINLDTGDEIVYIWEVKPASYIWDDGVDNRKTKGEQQIANYVNSKNTYFNGGMSPNIAFGKFKATAPLGAIYTILYVNMKNGLILYWFNRDKEDEEEKKEKAASLPAYNAAAQEAYNRSWEEQLKASSSQSTSESPEEIYINSDGDVVDNSGNIIYTATRLALYYTVATTLQAYYRLVNKSMNPTSESIVGEPICTAAKVQITMIKTSKYISSTQKVAGFIAAMAAMEPFIEAYDISAEEIEDDPEKINEILEDIKEKNSSFNNAAKAQPPRDPLIIDLGKQGIELTTLDNGVNFDIDNNTFAEKTAWIGLEDGFLVLDRNENGKIDNGGELFGDQVILKSGLKSTSGFEALMEFDENKDGVIDKKDAIYSSLKVWIDENQNGISESNELKTLTELSISSINLKITQEGKIDTVTGTMEASSSEVVFTNGTKRKISEFWFPVDLSNTTQDGNVTSGNVPSLIQAIEDDETGRLFELWIRFQMAEDIASMRYYSKQIMYFITNSTDIEPNSRGGNIDARDMQVIEKFMGREFEGVSGPNPNAPAAQILKTIYTSIENSYFNIVNLQAKFGGYMLFVHKFVGDDEIMLDWSLLDFIIDSKIAEGENVDTLVYDLGVYLKSFDAINGTKVFDEYSETYSQISNHYAKIVELSKSGNTFIGTDGNDKFNGTVNNDFIFGGTGDDILNSGGGNDTFVFGLNHGNDVVIGGKGTNTLVFENGINFIDYTTGTNANMDLVLINKETSEKICIQNFISNPAAYDFIFDGKSYIIGGGTTSETINGTDKDDELVRSLGFNTFYGGNGNDTIRGGDHIDIIYGEDGNDKLYGGNSTNFIFGELGNDEINDGDKSSYLCGGDGDDKIYAGGGDDALDGGNGNDYLQGDHGNDVFVYKKGYGTDVISDSDGKNTIKISGFSSKNIKVGKTTQSDAVIKFDGSNEFLIIKGYFYTNNAEYEFIFDDGTKITNKISYSLDMKSGDLNLDGKVDNLDLVVLCQYLIKTYIISNEIVPYADLNRDGVFDVADLAILKQYLMGDNVNIG